MSKGAINADSTQTVKYIKHLHHTNNTNSSKCYCGTNLDTEGNFHSQSCIKQISPKHWEHSRLSNLALLIKRNIYIYFFKKSPIIVRNAPQNTPHNINRTPKPTNGTTVHPNYTPVTYVRVRNTLRPSLKWL